ncbi:expansin A20 [Actinidia rufa]|uniref:Expansin A20 n=1 Tax=Actinidia rufa TaxID=165716 RepID=A0A7J0DNA4_9ERIC|nr:expansin A20 [Actinidia rufa]
MTQLQTTPLSSPLPLLPSFSLTSPLQIATHHHCLFAHNPSTAPQCHWEPSVNVVRVMTRKDGVGREGEDSKMGGVHRGFLLPYCLPPPNTFKLSLWNEDKCRHPAPFESPFVFPFQNPTLARQNRRNGKPSIICIASAQEGDSGNKESRAFLFSLQSPRLQYNLPKKESKEEEQKGRARAINRRSPFQLNIPTCNSTSASPHMGGGGAFEATVIYYLILLLGCKAAAQDAADWMSVTATYSKQIDASIIIEGARGYSDLHRTSYGKYSAGLSSMLFSRGSTCGGCFEETQIHVEHQLLHRVKCDRSGGMRFTVYGTSSFYQVLITNVGSDGQVVAVKVKGSKTGWIPMGRNWGQNWQCNVNLAGQSLSFEVTTSSGKTVTSYNVAPANWRFGQTFQGKQF